MRFYFLEKIIKQYYGMTALQEQTFKMNCLINTSIAQN